MDPREMENFFESRGADRECPACGHDGLWARIQDDLDLALPVHEHQAASIRAAVFICQNCGFMRVHARDVIEHNLRDGDEGPGEPEPSAPTPRRPGDTARH